MGIDRGGVGTCLALGFESGGDGCARGSFVRDHDGWFLRVHMFPDRVPSLRKSGPIAHDSITGPRTSAVRGTDYFGKLWGEFAGGEIQKVFRIRILPGTDGG
jgi:hypothetical protein